MQKNFKYYLTIIWFCYLVITSILLFTKGFLLTREVQDNNATCLSISELYCSSQVEAEKQSCFFREDQPFLLTTWDKASHLCIRPHLKVILIIVDALRYDFTVFNEQNINPLPYENKLPVIQTTLTQFPNSTRLFRFIADPPTTTMQRLKALTTGSLPTFIDAGSNFATSEINEDNIIDQVLKNNYTAIFMGDDTWTSLYPKRFLRNYPYPSFDVWDLDTVDNGVKASLFPELNNSDWNLLIGHFLGVDHCGHRYGPNHPEMSRKLSEINGVLEKVINVMDEDTMLFVIGDHGMTTTGDHGGESFDEVTAAMFVHSKRPLSTVDINRSSVKQVDLVPTLSAILGIPIPFQNLGILIQNCLPVLGNTNRGKESWQLPLFWLWGNIQQIVNYIHTYSEKTNIFEKEYLHFLDNEYNVLHQEIHSVGSEKEYIKFSQKAKEFAIKLRTLCEEVWIQFDPFLISNGLTFLFLSVFFIFILSDGIPLKDLAPVIEGSFVVVSCAGLLLTATSVMILDYLNLLENGIHISIFITNVLSYLVFLLPVLQNWGVISLNWHDKTRKYGIIKFICRLMLFFNILVLFSNSFINEEANVLLFLLVTIIFLTMFIIASFLRLDPNSKQKTEIISKSLFIKLALACLIVLGFLRASMYFWRCRVEQEWCFASPHEFGNRLLKSKSTKLQWGISVIALAVFISLHKMWLKKCGNINGYSITEMFTKLIPTVIVVCIAGFWMITRLSGNKPSSMRTANYLALSVYGLTTLSIAELVLKPLCVFIVDRRKDVSAQKDENVVPQIYNKLKVNFNRNTETENIPIVCGLGTAYSAVFLILATYLTLLVALVLGDTFSLAVVIMFVVTMFTLVSTSILRIKSADSIEDLFNVPGIAILGWIILAQYFFYAFGHQPAFPNIAWESAFVGTSGIFTNNYILGTLIILNTFGSYIVLGILLPLLVIAPFTLFAMMPSVLGKQKEFCKISERGELMLFEKEKLMTASLFSLSCKYIAGHAVKVFASMLAATIHCRHLMVWNVFAPKFIFEGIALFVTVGSVLLGYLLFMRIHSRVGRLVSELSKMS